MLLKTSVLVTLVESENMLTAEICTSPPSLHKAYAFTREIKKKIMPGIQVRNENINLHIRVILLSNMNYSATGTIGDMKNISTDKQYHTIIFWVSNVFFF